MGDFNIYPTKDIYHFLEGLSFKILYTKNTLVKIAYICTFLYLYISKLFAKYIHTYIKCITICYEGACAHKLFASISITAIYFMYTLFLVFAGTNTVAEA